jgi:hypothetical protein
MNFRSPKPTTVMPITHNLKFGLPFSRFCITIDTEDDAMESILHLNLHDDDDKAEATNLPGPENKEPETDAARKKLNEIANKAAHKAAGEYRRNTSNIFSK